MIDHINLNLTFYSRFSLIIIQFNLKFKFLVEWLQVNIINCKK
jgi:hypothetical protein